MQALCVEARRRFYSYGSIAARRWDAKANARGLLMAGVCLALSHFGIDRRQGLRLRAGRGEEARESLRV